MQQKVYQGNRYSTTYFYEEQEESHESNREISKDGFIEQSYIRSNQQDTVRCKCRYLGEY